MDMGEDPGRRMESPVSTGGFLSECVIVWLVAFMVGWSGAYLVWVSPWVAGG